MTRIIMFTSITISFLLFLITSKCSLSADTIKVNGSGSALDMMKPMIAAYKNIDTTVRIKMEKPLGSSGAIKALIEGAIDLAVSSKPLKPEETAKGCQLKEFGKTPLVIVTEQNVKITDISTKELEDIYNGKILKWTSGENLRLVLRPREDIDTSIIHALSPEISKAMYAAMSRPGMIVAVTDPEAYMMIIKTPGAIGAASLTSIIVEQLPINTLSLNKVKPTIKALADGSYPLAKHIDFVVMSRTTPEVNKFLNFIYSAQGRQIAAKTGVLITAK
jgi:phosphate transport system substrate-binding protein